MNEINPEVIDCPWAESGDPCGPDWESHKAHCVCRESLFARLLDPNDPYPHPWDAPLV
jgi:hypothetical protein